MFLLFAAFFLAQKRSFSPAIFNAWIFFLKITFYQYTYFSKPQGVIFLDQVLFVSVFQQPILFRKYIFTPFYRHLFRPIFIVHFSIYWSSFWLLMYFSDLFLHGAYMLFRRSSYCAFYKVLAPFSWFSIFGCLRQLTFYWKIQHQFLPY